MRYLLGSIGVEAEKGYMRCNGSKDGHKCNPVKVHPPIRVVIKDKLLTSFISDSRYSVSCGHLG